MAQIAFVMVVTAIVVIIATAMVIVTATVVVIATAAMVIVATTVVIIAAAMVVIATAAVVIAAAAIVAATAGAAIVTTTIGSARRWIAVAARALFVAGLIVGHASHCRCQRRTLIKLRRGQDLASIQRNATALIVGTGQRTTFCDRHHRSNRRLSMPHQIQRRSRQRKYYEQSLSYGFPDCRHCLSPWDCAATTVI
jgi:hypothetical protein